MPTTPSDPLARQTFSRSASSTDCTYAYAGLTCEKPRLASVSGCYSLSGSENPS
jgi:hypothetical protein